MTVGEDDDASSSTSRDDDECEEKDVDAAPRSIVIAPVRPSRSPVVGSSQIINHRARRLIDSTPPPRGRGRGRLHTVQGRRLSV